MASVDPHALARQGRAAWPELALSTEAFRDYLGQRIPRGAGLDSPAALHVADLYLAAACAAGEEAAQAAFERLHGAAIDGALAGLRLPRDLADDARQEIRQKLFVPRPGHEPKIATYSGRTDLGRWVKTVAMRTGISLLRKASPHPAEDEPLADLQAAGDDPELRALKQQCRAGFKTAFQEAISALSPGERNLLRFHYLDGLSIDQIGAAQGVHRATAARRLASAREALAKQLRRELRKELGAGRSQLGEIARLVESQIDLSLPRFLR